MRRLESCWAAAQGTSHAASSSQHVNSRFTVKLLSLCRRLAASLRCLRSCLEFGVNGGSIGQRSRRSKRMRKSMKKSFGSGSRARVRSDHALVGDWEDPERKMQILVRYNHPLIGTWQEVENPISETSVVYRIAVLHGRFVVSGIDEDDGTKLKISNVRWDGSALSFTSVFPPTGHRAKHVLSELRRGLVNHWVTSTAYEVWRKRPQKRGRRTSTSKLSAG